MAGEDVPALKGTLYVTVRGDTNSKRVDTCNRTGRVRRLAGAPLLDGVQPLSSCERVLFHILGCRSVRSRDVVAKDQEKDRAQNAKQYRSAQVQRG